MTESSDTQFVFHQDGGSRPRATDTSTQTTSDMANDADGAMGNATDDTTCGTTCSASNTVTRSIYALGYYTSFCTVFPVLLAASVIPRESAIARGFAAGARDAHMKEEAFRQKASQTMQHTGEQVGSLCAGVTAKVAKRVETIQDSIAERKYQRHAAPQS